MFSRNPVSFFFFLILFQIGYITQTFRGDIDIPVLGCRVFVKSSQQRPLEFLVVIALERAQHPRQQNGQYQPSAPF